ncbi:FAD-dependent oxidoreductase [Microbacterium excoecariae]|uniref:FAD-dependent oxidoreductase n=1 Tax=Microbacterium excoecariae TaxID=2715210 RepID=UPI00140CE5D5|nr:FAD-dependent oxidoreductase [Microbacterium excoecariae]NHI16802.1 NAD(P)/FAD-dependent oxidoreductase [Microbacterium excoecariae]
MTDPLRVVLVGFGPVGVRFAEDLLPAVRDGRVDLTVLGAEEGAPYNRILLAEHAAGDLPASQLAIADPQELTDAGASVRTGQVAVAIDRARGEVELEGGGRVPFDRLVLATGARARVPALDGLDVAGTDGSGLDDVLTDGVCGLRTLGDAERVRRVSEAGGRIVVLGAGVLGLELALLLAAAGARPALAHFGPAPMPRQLDRGAARVVTDQLAAAGVRVVPHTRAEAIVTDEVAGRRAFRALVSGDGKVIRGDLLVLSCGVTPRDELASSAGLRTARGVLVDERLRSWTDPRIHAIGDVAHVAGPEEFAHVRDVPGGPSGLVGPGWRQAEWLAADILATLKGRPHAPFIEEAPGVVLLKASQLDLVAAGSAPADPFAPVPSGEQAPEVALWADPAHGTYLSMQTTGGVLAGFVAVGMPRAAAELALLYQRGAELPSDRSLLLRRDAADEAPPASGADRTVCMCNAVTAGRIEQALAEDGCRSVEDVGRATRAGTGCGGCRARINEMLAAWEPAA